MPYYEKIKEYNNLEQRDIWEYDLDLTQEEINRLVLHTYELKDSYSDYYFLVKIVLIMFYGYLKLQRKDLDLVSKFNFKTIPLDTIKILEPYNLIKDTKFRYSNMRKWRIFLKKNLQ